MLCVMDTRITPAHAGTMDMAVTQRDFYRDHPRARGDHLYEVINNRFHEGSPPRTRGPYERRRGYCLS